MDNNSFSTRILPLLWGDVLSEGITVQRVFEITTSRLSAASMSSALKLIFLPGFPLLPTSSQQPVSKRLTRAHHPKVTEPKSRTSNKGTIQNDGFWPKKVKDSAD